MDILAWIMSFIFVFIIIALVILIIYNHFISKSEYCYKKESKYNDKITIIFNGIKLIQEIPEDGIIILKEYDFIDKEVVPFEIHDKDVSKIIK